MESAIITKGHFDSARRIILEEDIPYQKNSFEVILRVLPSKSPIRKEGTLKGLFHLTDTFDEPIEDFKEYMK